MRLDDALLRIGELEKEIEDYQKLCVDFRRAVDNQTLFVQLTRDPDKRETGVRILDKLRGVAREELNQEAIQKEREEIANEEPVSIEELTEDAKFALTFIQQNPHCAKGGIIAGTQIDGENWVATRNELLARRLIVQEGEKKGARYRATIG